MIHTKSNSIKKMWLELWVTSKETWNQVKPSLPTAEDSLGKIQNTEWFPGTYFTFHVFILYNIKFSFFKIHVFELQMAFC